MGKYLSTFDTLADYEAATSELGYPNVSLIKADGSILYAMNAPTPPSDSKWKATYFDSTVESAQCDSTSAITKGDVTVENIASFEIGDCVTSIGDELFFIDLDQAPLTSVTFGNNVASIGHDAFTNCTGLTEVVLPDSVTSIGDYAFSFCSNLRSINIPSGVTSIGRSAFNNCSGLTSVTIEATTPPTLGRAVFDSTNTNLVIYVPAASVDAYKAASGWSDYASRIQAIP